MLKFVILVFNIKRLDKSSKIKIHVTNHYHTYTGNQLIQLFHTKFFAAHEHAK